MLEVKNIVIQKAQNSQPGDMILFYARDYDPVKAQAQKYRIIADTNIGELKYYGAVENLEDMLKSAKEEISYLRHVIPVSAHADRYNMKIALMKAQYCKKILTIALKEMQAHERSQSK